MSSTSKTRIFFIGMNDKCEFGLNDASSFEQLQPCSNTSMTKIYCGYSYNIFSDDNLTNIWASGANDCGETGVGKPNMSDIMTYTPIEYFKQNQIDIKKICVNVTGSISFFISQQNKLYASGKKVKMILGMLHGIEYYSTDTKYHAYEPMYIPDLQNVIDAQSCDTYKDYCIALCSSDDEKILKIIQNWSRMYNTPQDIISLLVLFTKSTAVYATTNHRGTGHTIFGELGDEIGWNKVQFFDDKNIIKIAVGSGFTLFLDGDGVVWVCGKNTDCQLGFDNEGEEINGPIQIEYFKDNDIRIQDIACGDSHCLAVDVDGKLYSWGRNYYGQCGVSMDNMHNVMKPTLIETLKEYKIVVIRCGNFASYVKTECDKHFMFGSNDYGELFRFDGIKNVRRPHRVDKIILNRCKAKKIIDIHLGYFSTKVIVGI